MSCIDIPLGWTFSHYGCANGQGTFGLSTFHLDDEDVFGITLFDKDQWGNDRYDYYGTCPSCGKYALLTIVDDHGLEYFNVVEENYEAYTKDCGDDFVPKQLIR